MRWPFSSWLRGTPGHDDPAPASAAPSPSPEPDPISGPSVRGTGVRGTGVEARPAAWRDLPAVQRTIGAAPLTAPSAVFARDLATRDAPDPILRPLGHDVTADGPAGLVSGIAAPLVQRMPSGSGTRAAPALLSPAPPGRGRATPQHGATTIATLPPRGAPDAGTGPTADGAGLEEASAGGRSDDAPGGPAAEGAEGTLRALPVARLAIETPAIAATRVADATAPPATLAVARVVLPAPPEHGAATRDPAAPAAIVTDAAMPAEPEPVAQPDAAAASTGRGAADVAGPVVARRTLGESRRLGLGAPLAGPPPSAGRATGQSDLPVARRARSADAALPTPELLPARPLLPPAAAGPAPLPRLVVARRAAPATTIAAAPDAMPQIASSGEPAAQPVREAPTAPSAPDAREPFGAAGQVSSSVGVDSSTGAPAGTTDAAGAAADALSPARPLVGASPIGVSRLVVDAPAAEAESEAVADRGPGAQPRAWTSVAAPGRGDSAGTAGPGSTSGAVAGVPLPVAGGTASDASAAPGAVVARSTSDLAGTAAGSIAAARGAAGATGPAGPSPTTSSAPASLPLAAARAISSSPSASIASLGRRPTEGPSAVVARLAGRPLDIRDADGNRSPSATPVQRLGAATIQGVAVQRDLLPMGARPAPGSGRGSPSAGISPLPLAHAATGPAATSSAAMASAWAEPGGIALDRSDGALGWTPAAGFTSIAAMPGPSVQRAVEIDEMTATVDASAAAAAESGGAGAGQAGPAAAPAAGAGPDYEELAEHLYDRIRARLTTELLLDRERSGTLVDA